MFSFISRKINFITLIFVIVILYVFYVFQWTGNNPFLLKQENLSIAACPTFYYLLDELESSGINVIRTNSTSESIYRLQNNQVDLIISGRKLRPEEPVLKYEVFGAGFSLLAEREIAIYENEMGGLSFFYRYPTR
jgi:hypothetical protein